MIVNCLYSIAIKWKLTVTRWCAVKVLCLWLVPANGLSNFQSLIYLNRSPATTYTHLHSPLSVSGSTHQYCVSISATSYVYVSLQNVFNFFCVCLVTIHFISCKFIIPVSQCSLAWWGQSPVDVSGLQSSREFSIPLIQSTLTNPPVQVLMYWVIIFAYPVSSPLLSFG